MLWMSDCVLERTAEPVRDRGGREGLECELVRELDPDPDLELEPEPEPELDIELVRARRRRLRPLLTSEPRGLREPTRKRPTLSSPSAAS